MGNAQEPLNAFMRNLRRSSFQDRSSGCTAHEDPLEDWRGHLALSGYYPCAGADWRPIQVVDAIDTWLYADYAPLGNENPDEHLKTWLQNPPGGMELELLIEDVAPMDLSDWAPWPYMAQWSVEDRVPVQLASHPVAMFARYRRSDGRPLRLVYVVGEATATFLAVYGRQPFTPWLLCLIQMGYGLGGGWNRFFDAEDPACLLRHAFRAHPAGLPPFLLCNDYLPPAEFPVILEGATGQGESLSPELHLRKTHDRYRPRVADLGLLREAFPGLDAWPSIGAGSAEPPRADGNSPHG